MSFGLLSETVADIRWEQRDQHQGWDNVQRLNIYLAKRRVYEAGGDIHSVRVGFPFLGPKATPELVMMELLKVDVALKTGDFEVVEDLDEGLEVRDIRDLYVLKDAGVQPYDGPNAGVTVLAGQEDGKNVPSKGVVTLAEEARRRKMVPTSEKAW